MPEVQRDKTKITSTKKAGINTARMSHTVTVTRTTTTTTTSAIILNTGYLKTLPGLMKVLEVVVSAICLALLLYYRSSYYYYNELFLCVLTAVLVGSGCLLLACILSISTASMIPKTMYEVIYHLVAFVLCLAASITLIVELNRTSEYSNHYKPYLTASILGLILTVLYLISMVLSFRSYRGL